MTESESESSSESEKEKIKISYNNVDKEINTPEDYKGLLTAFLKEFNTDKEKEYIFFSKDNGKEKNINKDVTLSDFYSIKKVFVKEHKKDKDNESADEFVKEVEKNLSEVSEDESQEKDDEKIKIVYNKVEKEINTPDDYKKLLSAFLKAFNTDKDKEYIFFYKDNGKEKNINKEVTLSDFYSIKKVLVKEHKQEKDNESADVFVKEVEKNISEVSEDESQEKDDEKIKIVYNKVKKEINTPDDYKKLLSAFLKEFNTDKDKEYIFFYKDNGKEKNIDKEVTLSDLNNIEIVYVKEPKKEKEKENEDEEVEAKPANDLSLSLFSNGELSKNSSETDKKSSSKQDINNEATLISTKEDTKIETQNSSDKKSEDKISLDKNSSKKKILETTINPTSISKNSLDKISSDKSSEDKKSVEEEDEYMKINPNNINNIEEINKNITDVKAIMRQLYKQKNDGLKKLENELKEKDKKIQEKDDEINKSKLKVGKKYKSQISELENEKNQLKSDIDSMEGNKSKEAKEQTKKNDEKQKEIKELNNKISGQKDVSAKMKSENEELSSKKKDLENQFKEWKKKLEDKIRKEKGGNSRDVYDLILPINNSYLEQELEKASKKKEEKEQKKRNIQLKLSDQFQKKLKKCKKEKHAFKKSEIIEKEDVQKKIIFERFKKKYGKENLDNNIECNDSGNFDELIKENKELKNKIKSLKKKKLKKEEIKQKQDNDIKQEESKILIEKEKEEKERKEKEEKERKEKEEKERKEKEEKEREEKERKEREEKERKEREEKERKEKERKEKEEKDEFSIFNNSLFNNNSNVIINEDVAPVENPKNVNNKENLPHDQQNESPIEYYSYKCNNNFNLSSYIHEKTESTSIMVEIENNGSQVWPEKVTQLKFDSKSQIKGDDLILKPQKPKEIITYDIKFNNLGEYKEGTYESYVYFYINEENYGERLVLRINIKKKDISEIDQNIEKIKDFRNLFDLSDSDYTNEQLYNALKNSDFDMELAFSTLFET